MKHPCVEQGCGLCRIQHSMERDYLFDDQMTAAILKIGRYMAITMAHDDDTDER